MMRGAQASIRRPAPSNSSMMVLRVNQRRCVRSRSPASAERSSPRFSRSSTLQCCAFGMQARTQPSDPSMARTLRDTCHGSLRCSSTSPNTQQSAARASASAAGRAPRTRGDLDTDVPTPGIELLLFACQRSYAAAHFDDVARRRRHEVQQFGIVPVVSRSRVHAPPAFAVAAAQATICIARRAGSCCSRK